MQVWCCAVLSSGQAAVFSPPVQGKHDSAGACTRTASALGHLWLLATTPHQAWRDELLRRGQNAACSHVL